MPFVRAPRLQSLPMPATVAAQRLDARRNREAVIESAIELLSANPNASMQQIADASGVGRTTVYRHFPNRDDLFRALFERIVAEARAVTGAITSGSAGAEEVLRELAPAMIALGLRFRFLHSHREVGRPALQRSKEVEDEPVARYLAAGQGRGEIRTDLPIQWMRSLIQAMAVAAMDDLHAGHFDEATAAGLLGDSMVAVLLAR